MKSLNTIRVVSVFEAAKGMLVLLAGFGALSLIHRDVQQVAEQVIGHLHLNPAKHYPQIFLDTAANLTNPRLWLLATFAVTYSSVRFIEAYGLWRAKRWAEWFSVLSGGIYIPFEVYELSVKPTSLALLALAVNVIVVGVISRNMRHRR